MIFNHISINDYFWIRSSPQLINFGFRGLPKDIHYSLSFSNKSPDFNFHVTKNTEDSKNKPKITIVCIDKKLLQEWLEVNFSALSNSLLRTMLQPLDIFELKNKYDNNLGFISFESLKNTDACSLAEQSLVERFREISKVKNKTRLKIKGDVEKRFEDWAESDELISLGLDQMTDLSTDYERKIDGGIIISEENAIHVIRAYNEWFSIKEDFQPSDFLNRFIHPELFRHLNRKIKRAIVVIRKAKTFDDTIMLNKPTLLVIKRHRQAT